MPLFAIVSLPFTSPYRTKITREFTSPHFLKNTHTDPTSLQKKKQNKKQTKEMKHLREKQGMPMLFFCANFWLPCPLREMMKFSKNKRYNGKTARVLNNYQLQIPSPSEEQNVLKLCFFNFSIV